jgi:hypothetical protein|tara:strand:+ start:717 stop:950 length:234 start_codon:yes stop_codon:yes gene_type:complete
MEENKVVLRGGNPNENEQNTNIWIVLNEKTLNTMKGKHGRTAKFLTEAEANTKAASKLDLWVCINVHFNHRWINHKI